MDHIPDGLSSKEEAEWLLVQSRSKTGPAEMLVDRHSVFDIPRPVQRLGPPLRLIASVTHVGTHHVEFSHGDITFNLAKTLWRAQGRPADVVLEIPNLVSGL